MTEGYLPGYTGSAARMVASRSAAERAAFIPPTCLVDARVLDIGCGPGSITAGLAERMGTSGRLVALDAAADHLQAAQSALQTATVALPCWMVGRASVYALPLPTARVDLVYAHALIEHLDHPAAAIAEMRRMLRPTGVLALVASDWSAARLDPASETATCAIEGYRRLRRQASGDPDAGGLLAELVTNAGFLLRHHQNHLREDMTGAELATYIAARLDPYASDPAQREARDAAQHWASQPAPATVLQSWTEVLATAGPIA